MASKIIAVSDAGTITPFIRNIYYKDRILQKVWLPQSSSKSSSKSTLLKKVPLEHCLKVKLLVGKSSRLLLLVLMI